MTPSFQIDGFRVQFYAADRFEPPHVHVSRDGRRAKYWLQPLQRSQTQGFSQRELDRIESLLRDHEDQLLKSWHDFFE